MNAYELLKVASKMSLTDEKLSMLRSELRIADKKFADELRRKKVDDKLLSKRYYV